MMIDSKHYFNTIARHREEYFNLKIPFGNVKTKDFPDWLKEIINLTYKIGLSQIKEEIKEYEKNHRFDNRYNSYLGMFYLTTYNHKTIVNSAIHPKEVWVASLNGIFEGGK